MPAINAQGTFGRDIVAIKLMHIKQERRNLQAIMTKVPGPRCFFDPSLLTIAIDSLRPQRCRP